MVNKCAAPNCTSGYYSNENKQTAKFHFPLTKDNLNKEWIRFVNRKDWNPTKHSVLCEHHFEEKFITRGEKCTLKWALNPAPSIYPPELLKSPSSLPTKQTHRKPPSKRILQEDELTKFQETDGIKCLQNFNKDTAPAGFQFKRLENNVLFYNIEFDEETKFPTILESIKVDEELYVQLQYYGLPLPLPLWFTQGHNAKLTKLSMLENLPSYIRNVAEENHSSILNELKQRQFYKPQGRPPYSAEMIRYALQLRYTSLRAYKLLLEKFPMPSISLLNKIQKEGVDSLKALKLLCEGGKISKDCVMMVDEMYLQKSTQYQSGEYVGADSEGNLYKGIVAFMVVGLKESTPYIVQAIPEVKFSGIWLSERMIENLVNLIETGFCVRAMVTDNHSVNVNAFSEIIKRFHSVSNLFIEHPLNNNKKLTYIMTVFILLKTFGIIY